MIEVHLLRDTQGRQALCFGSLLHGHYTNRAVGFWVVVDKWVVSIKHLLSILEQP